MVKRHTRVLTLLAFGLACQRLAALSGAEATGFSPAVQAWLDAQTNVTSWAADFVQTRYLKTLKQPLTSTGQVWFAAPGMFRWELGKPVQSIAIRATNEVVLLYPRLKRAEKYALDENRKGPWREALALLEAGFPRDREQLEKQFEILSQDTIGPALHIHLRPKAASARALMSQITIAVNIEQQQLLSTELTFADGSRMRNDFSRQELNPLVDPEVFSAAVPAGYTVSEPLKNRR